MIVARRQSFPPAFMRRNDALCERALLAALCSDKKRVRRANIALIKHWMPRLSVPGQMRARRTLENLESQA